MSFLPALRPGLCLRFRAMQNPSLRPSRTLRSRGVYSSAADLQKGSRLAAWRRQCARVAQLQGREKPEAAEGGGINVAGVAPRQRPSSARVPRSHGRLTSHTKGPDEHHPYRA